MPTRIMNKERNNDLNDLLNKINSTIGDEVLEGELDAKIDDTYESSVPENETMSEGDELDDIMNNVVFHNHANKPSDDEKTEEKAKKEPKQPFTKRAKVTTIVGAVMLIFFVIGFISAVVQVFDWSSNAINKTELKQELAYYVFPAVIVDVPEFTNPSSLDPAVIIQSAVWKLILDQEDELLLGENTKSSKEQDDAVSQQNSSNPKYVQDEFSNIHVPQIDVELYIRKLYGPDVKVEHKSVGDATFPIDYIPEEETYIFQSTPQYLSYMPNIAKVSKQGDIYTLDVEYRLPNPLWHLDKSNAHTRVDKTMVYTVKNIGKGEYQLLSVAASNAPPTSSPGSDVDPTPDTSDAPPEGDPSQSVPAEQTSSTPTE